MRPRLGPCLRFPLAAPERRRDVVVGGLRLLVPLVGWIVNLGHRLEVVHGLVHGLVHGPRPVFPGFRPVAPLLRKGLRAFGAIVLYLAPSATLALVAATATEGAVRTAAFVGAAALLGLGVFVLPGGMTWNAAHDDMSMLHRPDRAWRRAREGGWDSVAAWGIALVAITLSFAGLVVAGVGFLFTSAWAWHVAGYAFSTSLVIDEEVPRAGHAS